MKLKILSVAVFAATAATVALVPLHQSVGAINATGAPPEQHQRAIHARPQVEVVFVLDTTSSMSGMIQAAKDKIWSIATTMASAQEAPEIKIGLVAFRDRGDAYVTKLVDLSGDLDSVYAKLMDFRAVGGGDTPESVNQALDDAVHRISWSQDANTYKAIFLVGDAPPHMDYRDDVKYPQTLVAARHSGIVVNAIQCGPDTVTAQQWQQIASLGHGGFFQVAQSGSAVAIATPFDAKLATLSAELDQTRLSYGDEKQKARQANKQAATAKLHETASLAARARRAEFNASPSGKTNRLGESDLVDDIASGKVELENIAPTELPATMRDLAPVKQQALIEETAQRRSKLQREIKKEAAKRSAYVQQKLDKSGGAARSLDNQLYGVIREQASKAGLSYDAPAPRY